MHRISRNCDILFESIKQRSLKKNFLPKYFFIKIKVIGALLLAADACSMTIAGDDSDGLGENGHQDAAGEIRSGIFHLYQRQHFEVCVTSYFPSFPQ